MTADSRVKVGDRDRPSGLGRAIGRERDLQRAQSVLAGDRNGATRKDRVDEARDHPRGEVVAPAQQPRAAGGVVVVGERLAEDVDVDRGPVADDMQRHAAPGREGLRPRPAAVDRREGPAGEVARQNAAVLDVEAIDEGPELRVHRSEERRVGKEWGTRWPAYG